MTVNDFSSLLNFKMIYIQSVLYNQNFGNSSVFLLSLYEKTEDTFSTGLSLEQEYFV